MGRHPVVAKAIVSERGGQMVKAIARSDAVSA